MIKRIASTAKRNPLLRRLLGQNRGEKSQAERRRLEHEVEEEIARLATLSEEEKSAKNHEVKSLIEYYHEMTSAIEDRRGSIYNFTLQYLVILLTALGVVIASQAGLRNWLLLIAVLLGLHIAFSLAIIVVFEFQSWFRYPFLKLEKFGNKWKWFYYGNPYVLKISRRAIFPSTRFERTQKPYLKGLKEFAEKYRTETLDQALTDNIQQLYLLQVHNYYKNQFYLALVRIRLWSLKCSVLVIVLWMLLLTFGVV